MKSILVPTDFSEVSSNALAYTITLAKEFKAAITLLHAYHTIPARPEIPSQSHEEELNELRIDSEKKLESLCGDTRKLFQIECNFVNEEGYARDLILDYAEKSKPDLLIMGTETINPIDKIIFGTNTGKILKKVKCPFLIVPQEASYEPPKKIAFALDYHDSDEKDLKFALQLAKKFKSELCVLRVIDGESDLEFEGRLIKDFKDRVDPIASDYPSTWQLILGKNVAKQLEKFVEENSIDLLTASKAKLSLAKQLLGGVLLKNCSTTLIFLF